MRCQNRLVRDPAARSARAPHDCSLTVDAREKMAGDACALVEVCEWMRDRTKRTDLVSSTSTDCAVSLSLNRTS